MKDGVWMAIAAGAIYWAYKNGLGAMVGICPAGYQVAQDMLPTCKSSVYLAGAGQDFKTNAPPTQALPFPLVWGWDGAKWVQVAETPKWP